MAVKVKGDKSRILTDAEKASASKVERLICVAVDQNNNKCWHGFVLANGDGYCEWGRVNKALQHEYYAFGNSHDAERWLDGKVNDKLSYGGEKEPYTRQRTIATTGPISKSSIAPKIVAQSSLRDLAAKQIKSDPETGKLITWLADVNTHQITKNTQITYDIQTGSFTTPLGLVTPDGISEARVILEDLEDYVLKNDWENTKFKKALGNYLRIVPQEVGSARGWHRTVLAGSNFQKQGDILDSLEAALKPVGGTTQKGSTKSEAQDVVFNVTLELVSDAAVIARIRAKYNEEKGDHSDVQAYDVHKVWAIHITTVRQAYKNDGVKLSNNWELWHGTKASNLLSILKAGLIIPDHYANGWNYGKGVYFSDQSTKSIGYATGRWDSTMNIDRVFMLLANVGMGNYYVPSKGVDTGKHFDFPKGYDSTFAQGGKSGVANNEMIVYRTSQADLAYLIEFREGKGKNKYGY
jgi:poly [ADP-ribose] polymerase